MTLSYRAFVVRREIQRILATVPPSEVNARIEDVVGDVLAELEDNFCRARRREVFGSEEE